MFKPKFFSLLKNGISKEQLMADIMSGVVVGIVAMPLAIAFAVASNLSPEKGLITAVVAGFIISLLGGSRVQIGGPTGAFVVIVAGILQKYGIDGLIISTILAGVFLVIFGLFKLGSLLKYFPHSLIVGFTSAIAVIIFSTQIRDALGLPISVVPSDFLEKWRTYFLNIDKINWAALAITISTIIIINLTNRFTKRIPGSFVAIMIITPLVNIFNINVSTIETFFGSIPGNLTISIPHLNIMELKNYIEPALTIALLGAIESLLSAVVADGMISGNHRSNTELIAQGIANIVTPFLGGMPATGAIARTATNVKNGGRTPIAGMVHSVVLLIIMLLFAEYAKMIPMACLAGILIVVAYNMSEWRSFISIAKGPAYDSVVLFTTFFLTIAFDLTLAIQVGVVLSAIIFMKRMADIGNTQIEPVVDSDIIENYSNLPDDISVYEISGPFFFASARRYSEAIREAGLKCKILIIRMRHVPFIDITGVYNLEKALSVLKAENISVILSGVHHNVKKSLIEHDIDKYVPVSYMTENFNDALKLAKSITYK